MNLLNIFLLEISTVCNLHLRFFRKLWIWRYSGDLLRNRFWFACWFLLLSNCFFIYTSSKRHLWRICFLFLSRLFWDFFNDSFCTDNSVVRDQLIVKHKWNVFWNLKLDRNFIKSYNIWIDVPSVILNRHVHCEDSSQKTWSFESNIFNRLKSRSWITVLEEWNDIDWDVCPWIEYKTADWNSGMHVIHNNTFSTVMKHNSSFSFVLIDNHDLKMESSSFS